MNYQEILDNILNHGFAHYVGIQKQLIDLKLKHDGSDTEDKLKTAHILSSVLTIVGDIMHPAYGHMRNKVDNKDLDILIANRKKSLELNLVNRCSCSFCKSVGEDVVKEDTPESQKLIAPCCEIIEKGSDENNTSGQV